jgi:hypothetical protein
MAKKRNMVEQISSMQDSMGESKKSPVGSLAKLKATKKLITKAKKEIVALKKSF